MGDLLPHLSRLKRDKVAQTTAADAIKDALNDNDLLTDTNIGETYLYSNLGYNILGEIIAERGGPNFEDFIRNTLFDPAGINIGISHSPRIGTYDESTRIPWQEAQYHPNPGSWPDLLRVYEGAGGWIMSPLHLLKFLSTIDGFNLVNDILDDQRIDLLETPIDVSNNDWYMKGGGWTTTTSGNNIIGRGHNGAFWIGTRTEMRIRNNGKAGAMFINYNNDGDVGGAVANALNAILDNDDITWPCWSNNAIINTLTTTVSADGAVSSQEIGSELVINDRTNVITQEEIRVLNTALGTASYSATTDTEIGNVRFIDNNVTATFITPQQRRNPVAVVADFELCRSHTSLCNLDTIECWDGSLVGRDPNNDCEFFECPNENIISILCASDRLQCDDGTIVRRNATLGCEFNECPPCDDDDDDDGDTNNGRAVGRRLLKHNKY